MSDFECLMQLLGEDAQADAQSYMRELLKAEMKEVFDNEWVFPIDSFREIWKDAIEEMAYSLIDEYKEQIKKLLRKQLLEAIEEERGR